MLTLLAYLNTHIEFLTCLILIGMLTGFFLAMTGGGGSILSVPLLLYVTKIPDVHMIIGTSAFSVAINSFINAIHHGKKGNISWIVSAWVSALGVIGAFIGSTFSKNVSGKAILIPFSILMIVIAFLMLKKFLRTKRETNNQLINSEINDDKNGLFTASSLTVGLTSGFLGIGGGFLVVPLLVWLKSFSTIRAIGTSLVAIFFMGLSTTINYAMSEKVNWIWAIFLLVGGTIGGWGGAGLANKLGKNNSTLTYCYVVMLTISAVYMFVKNI
ncbi:TPA: sulfite exporter TauE/SafE family protein [Klebsiella michiganensis]|nr:sulfite exporter TauE/SafE family protein [Klebsiella michiganensis]ELS4625826.1 sulfite exporter TauE/SafE family protein [Klebsiella michiganensis]HCQ8473307.1 sulfite exporter TauE/SafE family protein [Klebsiella michiganensis]HCU0766891.1 sulfite exporter TauE/SafE family protein [Klebsiella michiganensis]HEP0441596.1 sulfite exporter TauE/SafE family protein [Klebsiella michiganensis]